MKNQRQAGCQPAQGLTQLFHWFTRAAQQAKCIQNARTSSQRSVPPRRLTFSMFLASLEIVKAQCMVHRLASSPAICPFACSGSPPPPLPTKNNFVCSSKAKCQSNREPRFSNQEAKESFLLAKALWHSHIVLFLVAWGHLFDPHSR